MNLATQQSLCGPAMQLLEEGRYEDAEQQFHQLHRKHPKICMPLFGLGISALRREVWKDAAQYLQAAIKCESNIPEFHFALGIAATNLAQLDKANTHYREAIRLKPDYIDAIYNLGLLLTRRNKGDQALTLFRQVVRLDPAHQGGWLSIGNQAMEEGQWEDARQYLQRLLSINSQSYEAYYNLGVLAQRQHLLAEALAQYDQALALSPKFQIALLNRAEVQMTLGEYKPACDTFLRAMDTGPLPAYWWQQIVEAIKQVPVTLWDEVFNPLLQACLQQQGIDHQPLAAFLGRKLLDEMAPMALPLSDEALLQLLHSERLTWLLTHVRNVDFELENWLIALRHQLLCRRQDEIARAHSGQWKSLSIAMAMHSYRNEYLYPVSEDELRALELLKTQICQTEAPMECLAMEIIGACYEPLSQFSNGVCWTDALLADSIPLGRLYQQQWQSPAQEKELRGSIHHLDGASGMIAISSQAVQALYEENPYPQWEQIPAVKRDRLAKHLAVEFPHLTNHSGIPDQPDCLMAGCGTGHQVVLTATSYEYHRILAIDLSRSSLAYAKRMALQYGLKGIEFAQADLLALGDEAGLFDVIFCGGVLHHLASPMDGWKTLVERLKPAGWMNIAVYSRLARTQINAARILANELGFDGTVQGIRGFREWVRQLPSDHPVRQVAGIKDFYSLSECRDLLFHVQEHQFSIPELVEMLNKLELEFMGFYFSNPAVMTEYRSRYPQDSLANDLQNWDAFEQLHPNLFISMYQFWVRRCNNK